MSGGSAPLEGDGTMAELATHDGVAELVVRATDTLCGATTLDEVRERYLEIVATVMTCRVPELGARC